MFVPKVNLKKDPRRRWAQPDRRFFACGACHLLARAYLQRHPERGFRPVWIRPHPGHAGNHVFVTDGWLAFDYHGHAPVLRLLARYLRRGRRYYPGWDAALVTLDPARLASPPVARLEPGPALPERVDSLLEWVTRAGARAGGRRWLAPARAAPVSAIRPAPETSGPRTLRALHTRATTP